MTIFDCDHIIVCMIKILLLLASNIPAACIGGAVFVFSLMVLELGGVLSCMVGIFSYVIAGTWIFPSYQFSVAELKVAPPPSNSLFKESEYQLAQMRAYIAKIRKRRIHKTARYIGELAENILKTIKKTPGDARTSQQFASYYLEPTNNILEKYLELASYRGASEKNPNFIERIELILDSVQLAFEKQFNNVINDGMLYLDLEIAALEETIEARP